MMLSKKLITIGKITFVSALGCLLMYSLKYRLDIDFHNHIIDYQLWLLSNSILLLTVLAIISCWMFFSVKIFRHKRNKLSPVLKRK